MIEKNIFAYKLFLSLNISDFNLFLEKNCNPPPLKKVTPLFPSKPPLKVEVLSSPPIFKIWLEAEPPPPSAHLAGRGVGAHYVQGHLYSNTSIVNIWNKSRGDHT